MSYTACSKCERGCDPQGERMTPPMCEECRLKAGEVNALVEKIMKRGLENQKYRLRDWDDHYLNPMNGR